MSSNTNLIQLIELEKLSNIIYSSNDINTVNYSNELIERFINTKYSFKCLFEYFFETKNTLTYFWIIDGLIKIVNKRFTYMDKEENTFFQQCLYELFSKGFVKYGNSNQPFIMNKIALLIITWIKFNYPENSPTIFDDYLNLSVNIEEVTERNMKVELFLVVLITFNDEYLKFRHTLNSFDENRSTLIKDSLRVDHSLLNILKVVNSIISLNSESFPDRLTILSLKVAAQLIDWNNIQLFEEIIISSQKILNNTKFTKLILELFSALVNKGMNLNEKINLLKYLDILNLIESFVKNKKICIEYDCVNALSEMVINLGLYFCESLVLLEKTSEYEESK